MNLKFGDAILEHSRTVRRAKARTLTGIGGSEQQGH